MSPPRVVSMGCRLNAFESEIIRELGGRAGLADAIVVNTCAVTAEAERQARQAIRREKRRNPDKRIIVTGCAAQLNATDFAAMPEVDRVVGNAEKLAAETWRGLDDGDDVLVADIMAVKDTAPHLIDGFDGRARAFVQVQQGCDHRCTFCIIPFARGGNRGVPLGRLVEQARKLAAAGYREIVLTGVDICSYGDDLPGRPSLGATTRRLLDAVPEIERLRLGSLDPAAMDDALFELLADEPRFMPHLHLSLQALDDMVLKRMKRRHTVEDAFRVAERARAARPGLALGADLIAGFPTETDGMFENTLAAARRIDIPFLHVFPYSERPGTPAARMPAVPVAVRKERAQRLRDEGERMLGRFLAAQQGATASVLVEADRRGLSEHYAAVELDADAEPGRVVRARITGVDGGRLTGQLAA